MKTPSTEHVTNRPDGRPEARAGRRLRRIVGAS